jgi:hypothetical protein
MAALEFCWVCTADIEDLHVVGLEHFIASGDHDIDQGIGKQNLVEVVQITLQLVVEGEVTKREVNILACSNWLLREDDRLNFLVNLD